MLEAGPTQAVAGFALPSGRAGKVGRAGGAEDLGLARLRGMQIIQAAW